MLLIFVLQMFFSSGSVALSERSHAAFLNPAGLYFNPALELLAGIYQDSTYRISMSFNNAGISLFADKDGIADYTISDAIGFKNIAFGVFYGKDSRYGFGVMMRPSCMLSIGTVYDSKNNFIMGSALNLLHGRLFLSGDYISIDSTFVLGMAGRPLKWLMLSARADKKSMSLGIDIFFGREAVSATIDTLKSGIEVIFSEKNYPSPFKSRHRWVKIELSGYKEYRKSSGFLFPYYRKNAFYDFVNGVQKLVRDDGVEGLYLDLRFERLAMYQKEELLRILRIAKKNGKKIVLFSDIYGMSDLPFMAIADKVILVPEGEVITPGFASTGMFFKGMLSKIGITVEAPKIGKYKSAVEPFIRENYSEPAREQVEDLLSDYLDFFLNTSFPKYNLKSMLDTAFFNSDEALKRGYVDTILHVEGVKNYIREKFGKKMKMVSYGKYRSEQPLDFSFSRKRPNIALLVLDGDIIRGNCSESNLPIPVLGGRHIGSYTVIRILQKLKQDKSIKGVVIRVNSPGGDALASEEMYGAVKSLAEKKPVVVSMASVAASGGYYISAPATFIMADSLTVTGSIGILNLKFVIKDMFAKMGLSTETVKIGEHADVFSPYRESTDEEKQFMKKELVWAYNMFLDRVAKGRGLAKDSVNTIAQGRVWSGARGREIGIVDSIGGILGAINKCAELAKVKEPVVKYVPCMRGGRLSFPFAGIKKGFLRIPREGIYYLAPVIEVR